MYDINNVACYEINEVLKNEYRTSTFSREMKDAKIPVGKGNI